MDRRSFFSFVPLGPMVLAGAMISESQKEETPVGGNSVRMLGCKKRKRTERPSFPLTSSSDYSVVNNGYVFDCDWETDYSKSITMSVGRDGNLWVKKHEGEWKRVVTE